MITLKLTEEEFLILSAAALVGLDAFHGKDITSRLQILRERETCFKGARMELSLKMANAIDIHKPISSIKQSKN